MLKTFALIVVGDNSQYIMNLKFKFVIVLVILLLVTGCKTYTTNGEATKVVNSELVVNIINGVVPVAVSVCVDKNPNSSTYLLLTAVVIDGLVGSNVTSVTDIEAALSAFNIDNADASLVVRSVLSIYRSFAYDAVTAKLEEEEYLVVLRSLSTAIKAGLLVNKL